MTGPSIRLFCQNQIGDLSDHLLDLGPYVVAQQDDCHALVRPAADHRPDAAPAAVVPDEPLTVSLGDGPAEPVTGFRAVVELAGRPCKPPRRRLDEFFRRPCRVPLRQVAEITEDVSV